MPSIIEGYNYDIFISYRQKDNKGDRWVSNFVDALKTELEATFKEDVSVYFDENPHDRLQETHNVDKSLEGKLNCLIFIPILSQTYCDPKSYAWQNEFLAFVKTAENDRFGKDVKLRSGNVAGRILPIRIHDLEQEDIKLFEKETGSVLRAMDFVFKTASGVNRPLKVNEDHPQDNLTKTFYADQINKVAHAIKEIILGMKAERVQMVKEKILHRELLEEVKKEEKKEEKEKSTKITKKRLLSGMSILVILIFAAVFAYPKIFKRDTLEKLRSSGERIAVAVIPFKNMTNDTTKNFWQEMIQDNLIISLSSSKELRVRHSESINHLIESKGLTNYASITPSIASNISQKLGANIFIYGSVMEIGSTIRLNAQLTDSKTQDVFKSFQIDGTTDNILLAVDSLSIQVKNFLVLSELIKELPADYQYYQVFGSANNPEAFRYSIYGDEAFRRRDYPSAVKFYLQAIAIDSNFTAADILLSLAYLNQDLYEQAKKTCLKVYKKADTMPLEYKIYVNWIHAVIFDTPFEEIKCLRQMLEIDDEVPINYYELGLIYNNLKQYNKSIPEFEKALEIYDKWESKPWWVLNYTLLGYAYHETGQYKKERKLYIKAERDFPDNPAIIYRQAILALSEGKTKDANYYIEKYTTINRENSVPEARIMDGVAGIFSNAGTMDKAEEFYRKALSLQPENPARLNNLAWFLIDKDRNVNEGLELIDKALELSPDDWLILDTKGWGLYKQSKFKEALEFLQKADSLKPIYDHEIYLHLEAAKKAVGSQKNN